MVNISAFFRPSLSIPSARHSGVMVATAGDEGPPSVRQARSAGGQLTAQSVDCVLSEWSAWSRCDTCQKKRVSVAFQRVSAGNRSTLQNLSPFTLSLVDVNFEG